MSKGPWIEGRTCPPLHPWGDVLRSDVMEVELAGGHLRLAHVVGKYWEDEDKKIICMVGKFGVERWRTQTDFKHPGEPDPNGE